MLTDDVTIDVCAGRGGNGLAAFARTKMHQGPTGGNGGKGGNVVFEAVDDLGALRRYRNQKKFVAPNGHGGEQNCREGANGKERVLYVPVGTLIHNQTKKESHEFTVKGERIVVVHGGNGGFGNFHYRSSRNTSPERANPGAEGEKATLRLELKLIADVGFVGYPNVGKSTLLNTLTNASSKVANYKFTTLEPHLGVYYELILADIPGLIEGAATGKGLGHKFLRHIERTRILFHFISAGSAHPLTDYKVIRAELGAYNKELLKKPEWIIMSQADLREDGEVEEIVEQLQKENKNVATLSIENEESVDGIKKILNGIKDKKH